MLPCVKPKQADDLHPPLVDKHRHLTNPTPSPLACPRSLCMANFMILPIEWAAFTYA